MLGVALRSYAAGLLYDPAAGYYMREPDPMGSLFWAVCAAAVLCAAYFCDYTLPAKHPVISCVLLCAALWVLPLVYRSHNGSTYYNSHYLYFLLPLLFAVLLWWWPWRGYGGLACIFAALVLMTLTGAGMIFTSSAVLYGGIGWLMLLGELWRGRFGVNRAAGTALLAAPPLLFAGWLAALGYRGIAERLAVAVTPALDPFGAGYVGVRLRGIFAGARWIGTGSYTWEGPFLPDVMDTYLLAWLIHRLGWIALAGVLALFVLLGIFSWRKIRRQRSRLGRMAATAITATLLAQCLFYIANNLIGEFFSFSTIPLLSYGNEALVVNAGLFGVLLSVFRSDDVVRDEPVRPKRVPHIEIRFHMRPLT